MLWDIYLDYYYNMDPKAGLEDWEEVFNDFLKKPDETLAYWKHYTSFDIPADESKWDVHVVSNIIHRATCRDVSYGVRKISIGTFAPTILCAY